MAGRNHAKEPAMPDRTRIHWIHWLIAAVLTLGLGGLSAAEQLNPSAPLETPLPPPPL